MLLDLENDYKTKQYLLFENSPIIAEQIVSYTSVPKPASAPQKTGVAYTPVPPCPLACRDQDCIRVGGSAPCFDPEAAEFRRDVITITKSRAFRRTVDKAQIYGAAKGDLFRTRMTHTQVVTQIALSISRRLGLNLDLTEAIALGHDIGHTPFGHQGERTLNAILKGD
ncbi:MAG: HD domain-containing protein, partial [Clostridia bacterium]|nr:HD domain-containing protein [Clostridia bacterium]